MASQYLDAAVPYVSRAADVLHTHRTASLCALGVAATIPLAVRDYRMFLSYGPGGLPYNPVGWLVASIARLFASEQLSTAVYSNTRLPLADEPGFLPASFPPQLREAARRSLRLPPLAHGTMRLKQQAATSPTCMPVSTAASMSSSILPMQSTSLRPPGASDTASLDPLWSNFCSPTQCPPPMCCCMPHGTTQNSTFALTIVKASRSLHGRYTPRFGSVVSWRVFCGPCLPGQARR